MYKTNLQKENNLQGVSEIELCQRKKTTKIKKIKENKRNVGILFIYVCCFHYAIYEFLYFVL